VSADVARQREAATQAYIRDVAATAPAGSAGSAGPADQIAKLAELKQQGILSDEEFERAKAKALS